MAAAVPRVTFAPTTPFLDDGSLDLAGLERTVRWLRGQGVTSIIAGGTTGEFPSMSLQERLAVLVGSRRAFGPDGFLFANVSCCALDDMLELTRQSLDSDAEPNALLLLPPFYFKPFNAASGSAGVEAYFRMALTKIADEIETRRAASPGRRMPSVFLYTFALHTQQPIAPDVYGRLCQAFPSLLAGIKASFVGLEESLAYASAAPGTTVMVGNGTIQLPVLRAGLHIVSGDCLTVSWALTKLLALHEAGKADLAERVQRSLIEVWRAEMNLHDEVPINKAVLALIKEVYTRPNVRPPLVEATPEAAAKVLAAAAKLLREVEALP